MLDYLKLSFLFNIDIKRNLNKFELFIKSVEFIHFNRYKNIEIKSYNIFKARKIYKSCVKFFKPSAIINCLDV